MATQQPHPMLACILMLIVNGLSVAGCGDESGADDGLPAKENSIGGERPISWDSIDPKKASLHDDLGGHNPVHVAGVQITLDLARELDMLYQCSTESVTMTLYSDGTVRTGSGEVLDMTPSEWKSFVLRMERNIDPAKGAGYQFVFQSADDSYYDDGYENLPSCFYAPAIVGRYEIYLDVYRSDPNRAM